MRQAILIGINRYAEQSGLMPLHCEEADAAALGELLRSRYGFGTTVLCGEEATQDRVLDALEHAGSGEVFLFFFAGHGSLSKGHYRLHMADDTRAGRRAIRFDDLAATFRHELRYPKVLTILDACRNEMSAARGARGFDAGSSRDLQAAVESGEEKKIDIFYGCSEGEFSYEDETLGHGLLTYSLLESLRSAGADLTSDALADLAAGRLRTLSTDRGWRQTLNRYYLPGPEKIVLVSALPSLEPKDISTRIWRCTACGHMMHGRYWEERELVHFESGAAVYRCPCCGREVDLSPCSSLEPSESISQNHRSKIALEHELEQTMSNPHYASDLARLDASPGDAGWACGPGTILLVTGTHPMAELFDRPVAERLRDAIDEQAKGHSRALVISDVWYFRDEAFQSHPCIAIGWGLNPLTESIAGHGEVRDWGEGQHGALQQDGETLKVALWGDTAKRTMLAVQRYIESPDGLRAFLEKVWGL